MNEKNKIILFEIGGLSAILFVGTLIYDHKKKGKFISN